MDQNKTGQLIRALRTELGMTQRQLADALGVTDRAVSKWERGVSHSLRYHNKYDEPTLIHYQL